MVTIRQMNAQDVDVVRQIDAQAFGAWWRGLQGEAAQLPERSRANVLSLLQKDPNGCFVAEEGHRLVGFIFSRTWGSVAWFGPFAVLPGRQGRGVGKQLIAASLGYLGGVGASVIGLETMPDMPDNLGLYLKQGFQDIALTLLLARSIGRSTDLNDSVSLWSSTDAETRRRWLDELREATAAIYPGLDYSKEIEMTARHGLGETLVLSKHNRAMGFATVWLVSPRDGLAQDTAALQVLALHPDITGAVNFRALLTAVEVLAFAQQKRRVTIPVNTRCSWALGQLLGWGYQVERAMARMALSGGERSLPAGKHVDLSRWAG
jgi:ribosomal protein S18 acetylase RimI-like enzyme